VSDFLQTIWTYAVGEGPWAVVTVLSNGVWLYLLLKFRNEVKLSNSEMVALIAEKEKELSAEKDARREEALAIQKQGYATLAQLVQLMDRTEDTLSRVEKGMILCSRKRDILD